MRLRDWSRSNFDYGRKLFVSGLEGARSGETTFLQGKPLTPVINGYVRHALTSASIGACIGALSAYPDDERASRERALVSSVIAGAIGGAIGFVVSVAWQGRRLARAVASSAWRKVDTVRDEHWLEKHPIDYA
ncbi:MAG TPA: hypothetical protein VE994_20165 [Terriglobales bacterium]|nr:hypothetical protein [Terriglobales bacterium]